MLFIALHDFNLTLMASIFKVWMEQILSVHPKLCVIHIFYIL